MIDPRVDGVTVSERIVHNGRVIAGPGDKIPLELAREIGLVMFAGTGYSTRPPKVKEKRG